MEMPAVTETLTIPINPTTLWIMGRPNFWCAGIAPALRLGGYKIPEKAEVEQAAVICWLLKHYQKYGEDYLTKADEELQRMKAMYLEAANEKENQ